MSELGVCLPRILPKDRWIAAAQRATEINPMNHPPLERLVRAVPGFEPTAERISVLTTKFWRSKNVHLSVGFLEKRPADLRARILSHMNAWAKTADVKFSQAKTDPDVRIAFEDDGYWSYLGTDVMLIEPGEATMNLQEFTMDTPESEFHRVVRHETGHTMGFPHEHMRRELVNKIDKAKAIKYFGETQGWSPEEVKQQVLTPLEESSLLGTLHADPNSIMCYHIPGNITKDGKPIIGGVDIDPQDFEFAGKLYPK